MASGKRIGYVRVSTADQNTARQLDGVSVDKLYTEKVSAKDTERPELQAMLGYVREGDTIVVHSIDRIARSLDDLRGLVNGLIGRGVVVEFVKEGLKFTGEDSSISKLMLNMLGAVAEFERSLILERVREGIAVAKAAGVYKGRKKALSAEQAADLTARFAAGESKAKLAREFGVNRDTVYRYAAAGTAA